MRKAQLQKYRRKLQEQHDDISALVRRSGQAIRTTREDGPDDSAAQAADSYSKEFLSHQSDTNFTQLNLVNAAIQRIDEMRFGHCQSCGKDIDRKRLDAVPWTPFCRACQESEEELASSSSHRNVLFRG